MSLLKDVSVIFEDDAILAINKPAGLSVHPDGRTEGETFVDWILLNRPLMKGVGEPLTLSSGAVIDRPGIVHRLDRETSGILILAKTEQVFTFFKRAFQNRKLRKEYHAFVYGDLPKEFGTIDRPIGRSRTDFRRWSAEPKSRGELREAETYYEVLGRGSDVTFVKVLPKTGRTHQIRVHFKAIDHPVVADTLYAPKRPKLLGFERLALHARSLEFTHPAGNLLVLEAPYPPDFTHALETFKP
jgi:23S rRNA pseudouridine1911/1915/1917 synthase